MQVSFPVGVLVQMGQAKSRLQLSAKLLLQCVGKLDARAAADTFAVKFLILKGVEWQRMRQLFLLFVEDIVDADVVATKKNATFFSVPDSIHGKSALPFLHSNWTPDER